MANTKVEDTMISSKDSRLHVLLTGNTAFKLANFRSGLIRELIEQGIRVTALVPICDRVVELEEMGCEVIPLRVNRKGLAPHQELMLFLKFWRIFSVKRPDVILSYTVKNNIYGALAARSLGIPFLPNITGLGTAFGKTGLLNRVVVSLYRLAFRGVPAVFFQNSEDKNLFLLNGIVKPNQVRTLPGSGVDTKSFEPALLPGKNEKTTFLMVSRLIYDKGVVEYVEAAKELRSVFPAIRFQLLGPFDFGNSGAIDRDLVEDWVRDGTIEYLSEVVDVRPVLKMADCVVLPSYYREGVPRSLLEAAAMARPILTTDAPGCRQVVEHGVTGFLFHSRDVGDLSDKMMQMIRLGHKRRTAMGLLGRKKMVQEFDESIVISAYLEEIEGVCPTELIAKSSRR